MISGAVFAVEMVGNQVSNNFQAAGSSQVSRLGEDETRGDNTPKSTDTG